MGTATQFSGAEAMRQNPLLLTPEAGFTPAEIPANRWQGCLRSTPLCSTFDTPIFRC